MLKPEVQRELLFYCNHQGEIEDAVGFDFMLRLLDYVSATETIEGDIIELGTYKGGTSIMIAHFLKSIGSKRHVYACDTFEGLPYDDKFSTIIQRKGQLSDTNISYVEDKFRRFSVADKIKIITGLFEDMLYEEIGRRRFTFAFTDCDLYEHKTRSKFSYSKNDRKGIIALHDYGFVSWGLTRARINRLTCEGGLLATVRF